MRDDEWRHLTPEEQARDKAIDAEIWAIRQDNRQAAGLCIRWGHGDEACIRPFDHAGVCEDRHGNTTLSITRALLGRG